MVARPKEDFKFIRTLDAYLEHTLETPSDEFQCSEVDEDKVIEENHGVVMPKGFDQAEVSITSIGVNLLLNYLGEPPAVARTDICGAEKIDSLALEKLSLTLRLGRQVEGFKQKKGYLLPLGVRASYITVLTREPHAKSRYKHDLSLPVERSYILIHKPLKNYPIIYQPHEGRQFPINRLEMTTTQTAEIVQPKIDEITGKAVGGKLIQSDFSTDSDVGKRIERETVFWPRIRSESGSEEDVEFAFQQGSTGSKVTGPLLFITNEIVNEADLNKEISNYYNSIEKAGGEVVNADPTSWPSRRTMKLYGTRHPYAPASKAGDTSFDSDRWLMKVQGRRRADKSEFFSRDRFLEGADHPALYPAVEKASINVQSVSALLGEAQKFATAKFNQKYLENGFDSGKNRGEIYLQFIGPDAIKFDVKKNSSASGGAASPSVEIAA